MNDGTKPPEQAVLDPHYVRNLWQRCRDNPVRAARVAALRERIEAGDYDRAGSRLGIAVENLMADLHDIGTVTGVDMVDKPNLADVIADGTRAAEDEAEEPERWDGLS